MYFFSQEIEIEDMLSSVSSTEDKKQSGRQSKIKIYASRKPMVRIRIRKFLSLQDPDPLVRGTDPASDPSSDPDPSIIKQK
jgi:hypothetical protein